MVDGTAGVTLSIMDSCEGYALHGKCTFTLFIVYSWPADSLIVQLRHNQPAANVDNRLGLCGYMRTHELVTRTHGYSHGYNSTGTGWVQTTGMTVQVLVKYR